MWRTAGSMIGLAVLMVGCGGGSSGDTSSTSSPPPPPTVGGSVTGLLGSGLALAICPPRQGGFGYGPWCGKPQAVLGKGGFRLADAFPAGYAGPAAVVVAQQPASPPQYCFAMDGRVILPITANYFVTVTCWDYGETLFVSNAADNTLLAYSVDETTGLATILGTPTATGMTPSAIAGVQFADKRFVFVGNQGSDDVSAFDYSIQGAWMPAPGSPFVAGSHPAAMAVDGARNLLVANAGDDSLSAYAIDSSTGALARSSTAPTGKGPSSIVVVPDGSLVFVANNGGSNDISAFHADLTPVAGSPFPAGGNPLSLALGAGGRFLYSANPDATNPGISGFSVDPASGALSPLGGSPFPVPVSHFIASDRTGAYLYVTSGANIVGYRIDAITGALAPLPGFPVAAGANAYSITIDTANRALYVANDGAANVSGFTLDASTGALTPMPGSPFPAGYHPHFVATF
jgi:6-phosphogluconolactonase (cycloisomerase 2 family)